MIGVDLVPERLDRARKTDVGVTIDLREHGKDIGNVVRGLTGGRGADAVSTRSGWRRTGRRWGPLRKVRRAASRRGGAKLMPTAGLDRLNAVYTAVDIVRRGGTISLSGVYGGMADPMPMMSCSTSRCSCGWGRPTCSVGRRNRAAADGR